MNPLLIIAGVAALIYVPTIVGLMKLEYKFIAVYPTKIEEKKFLLNIELQLFNNSPFRLFINEIVSDIYFQNQKIGTVTNNHNKSLLPKGNVIVTLGIQLSYDVIGEELWAQAVNKNLENMYFNFKGYIRANNKKFPFTSTWTMHDITQYF